MIEGRDLAGERCRMAHGVAQHEMTRGERRCVGQHPAGDRHRFPHVLVVGQRWREVVHEGDAGESGCLRGARSLDDGGVRHAHLRKEEVELGAHGRRSR